ncbi:MAG: hypothetical protein AAB350_00185 [Patescibacteria group bacterium]
MKIELKKFRTTLIFRQTGREAYSAFLPSWGDEFLSKLLDRFEDRLLLKKSDNPSVQATIEILEQVSNKKFKFVV